MRDLVELLQKMTEDLQADVIKKIGTEKAQKVVDILKLDTKKYPLEQLAMGIEVEYEHGTKRSWNITDDELVMTAKIALAHIEEHSNYYTILLQAGLADELTK